MLYLKIKAQDLIFCRHSGCKYVIDLGSLYPLKHILGMKEVTSGKPEYNGCKQLMPVCEERYALTVFSLELGVCLP